MSEETIHESRRTHSRRAIASYLRRLADALGHGEPVPADEAQTVTVDVPAEPEMEVEVEREDGQVSLDIEMQWPESGGEVETNTEASKATFDLYEDSAGEWRWRLVHANGNIIADGGEGYASKQKAKQGLQSVKQNARGAPIEEQE